MKSMEQLEKMVKELLAGSNKVLNKMFPIEEYPLKVPSIVVYILCKKLKIVTCETKDFETFLSKLLSLTILSDKSETVDNCTIDELKHITLSYLENSYISMDENCKLEDSYLYKYIKQCRWEAIVVKCFTPLLIDCFLLAHIKCPVYFYESCGHEDRFIRFLFSVYASLSGFNYLYGVTFSEDMVSSSDKVLYIVDLDLYRSIDFKDDLDMILCKPDSEITMLAAIFAYFNIRNVIYFARNRQLEVPFYGVHSEKRDFLSIYGNLVETPCSCDIVEFNNFCLIKSFIIDYHKGHPDHKINFICENNCANNYVCVTFQNRFEESKIKSLNDVICDNSILAYYMAKYTLRPSVFLLYKMVGELVSDFLLNSYKRGCQSISIELRQSDLLNWSESQKLIDMFKKITLLSKSTYSSNDIILDLYLTPCDNNIASHQRELYLLENATNRLSLQKKYVLKMIFVKLGEYIRSEASKENIFLQPIYYLFILNHVCVPKMLFSDDNMNIFARGIKLVLEANINMPFFNLEDVQNQSFYPLMQRVFDIFLVFNILVDNGDNTYSWHNYVPGEPIFNILRRNPIVKGMFFFLCCATNIIKVTIKLTEDGKSYSNKTNIHRYLQVYFPEMTEKKIKNTEDRFRKEVKEYWEKHQIQKDSYYDIVISYIKDYVENVYNKKKDKKKPKLNFKNDKKIQDFINSLESIKHKLVNLDLKTS